jgi:hypothetical protein
MFAAPALVTFSKGIQEFPHLAAVPPRANWRKERVFGFEQRCYKTGHYGRLDALKAAG